MVTLKSILDGIREAGLCCIGSPHSRTRQLAALRNLDAHLLSDIGITPEEARNGVSLHAAAAKGRPRPIVLVEFRRPTLNR